MKYTFTREEVIEIIKNIHEKEYDYSISKWAVDNHLDREQAVRTATDEYVATSILLEENN